MVERTRRNFFKKKRASGSRCDVSIDLHIHTASKNKPISNMAAQCLRVWRQRACSVRMPCISPVRPALRPPRPVAVPQRQHVVTTARGKMEESLDREIEATAAAIDAMVREVTKELFVDTAAAYVTGATSCRCSTTHLLSLLTPNT